MLKGSEKLDISSMMDNLPERLIINPGINRSAEVYRLVLMKSADTEHPYIIRYAKQTTGQKGNKREFSSKKYLFDFRGETLNDAVRLTYNCIKDVKERGYLCGDFNLELYLKGNPDPRGERDIDW